MGAELANQELDKEVAKWAKYFGDRMKTLINVQPEHKEERVRLSCGQVLLAMRKNHDLLKCTWDSVQECVQHGISLGLNMSWGPLGEAALVPYAGECTFIPGYKGLLKLARRGGLKAVDVDVLHAHDFFRLSRGPKGPDWEHRPMLEGDPGEARGYYCNLRFQDDVSQFTYMRMAEVMRIADPIITRSRRADSPWKVHFDEMAKKTALRLGLKVAGMDEEMGMALALSDAGDEREERDIGTGSRVPQTVAPGLPANGSTLRQTIETPARVPEIVGPQDPEPPPPTEVDVLFADIAGCGKPDLDGLTSRGQHLLPKGHPRRDEFGRALNARRAELNGAR